MVALIFFAAALTPCDAAGHASTPVTISLSISLAWLTVVAPAGYFVAALLHCGQRSLHLAFDGLDQLGDVAGGAVALLGQLAHLVGDHGKAAPGVAGAGRFDRGIERQQVGLVGDAGDDPDELADLAGSCRPGW